MNILNDGNVMDHLGINPLIEKEIILPDGRYLQRLLMEEDRAHVLDLFDHLSAKSRYYRYAQQLKTLPESLLQRIISAHHRDDLAIGSFFYTKNDLQGSLVGIARYVQEGDSHCAEFSLSVRDDFHHRGIGSSLMKNLFEYAKSNGFTELHGYVLADNHEMLSLMAHLGATISTHPEDFSSRITTFHL